MGSRDTIIISRSMFDDPGEKSHASLVVLKGAEIGRDFRLRKPSMTIGRNTTADICLHDDGVSREHARIDKVDNKEGAGATFVLTDLGSTNHTFVDSKRVESVELRGGEKIQIGDSVLKFVLLDEIEAKFHADVRDLISYDQLTGLLTKESLYLSFDRELWRCMRYDLPLAVLMMDVDHFKAVNDTYGHQMGSHVLAEIGRLIRDAIRTADISARYGGEEFISYLAETDALGADVAAERIRQSIENFEFVHGDQSCHVTISIGISIAPTHGESIETLVAAADQALYRAKASGRNRVCMA